MSDYPILTNKQRTHGNGVFAPDYIGDNCEMFFPFDEGSGTVLRSVVNGYEYTKAGIDFTVPHAVKGNFAGTDRSDSVVLTPKVNKHVVMFYLSTVDINSSVNTFNLGGQTSFILSLQLNNVSVNSSLAASVSLTPDTIVTTDTVMAALTFNKDTGEAKLLNGINGAVVLADTQDASAHLPAYGDMTDIITLGTFTMSSYGAAVLFTDSLPTDADMISMMEATRLNFLSGKKYYDPRLSNY